MSDCYFLPRCDCVSADQCIQCDMYYPFEDFDQVLEKEYADILKEDMEQLWRDVCAYD